MLIITESHTHVLEKKYGFIEEVAHDKVIAIA